MKRVLLLSDGGVSAVWAEACCKSGFELIKYEPSLRRGAVALLILKNDIRNLMELVENAGIPVILIRPNDSPDLAGFARKAGVRDYLQEPVSMQDLVQSIESSLCEGEVEAGTALRGGDRLVGVSSAMSVVRDHLARIADTDCNALVTGETGTGKELAAELIHLNSSRRARHFVCVNCAAVPETLLESELFGYEKGAFTGASCARTGYLELADGGTLFLDEIGEMSLGAQAKILRAIDSKEVQRLGHGAGIRVNVRIVCATNRDLEAEVAKGTFRADLFFRLNVARLRLPPLRERKSDLAGLVSHFLEQMSARTQRQVNGFTEHSWRTLLEHDWPGNVRELRNVVETCLAQLPFAGMRLMELPDDFRMQIASKTGELTESERLLAALVTHNWNKSKAAHHLRWSRMRLYRKMAQYQLPASEQSKQQGA